MSECILLMLLWISVRNKKVNLDLVKFWAAVMLAKPEIANIIS